MAENTRLKELQTEIRTHADNIRCTGTMMDLMQTSMDHIQLTMNQLLKIVSQPHGSPVNNDTPIVTPISVALSTKEISLGFPHFDGTTPVMEWIFKAEIFFSYHNTPDAARVDIVVMHFDKDVVAWFQMSQKAIYGVYLTGTDSCFEVTIWSFSIRLFYG